MNIRNRKELKRFAWERLSQTPAEKKLVLIYAGILLAMSLGVLAGQLLLEMQINKTSGLGSLGLRSTLSTIQSMLPIVQMGVSLCLGLGYLAAALRIARGQYVSPNTLRLGFDRFWPLLRLVLIETMIYSGAIIVGVYGASAIFVLTPLSREAMAVLMPVVQESSVLNPSIVLDMAVYDQLLESMIPMFLLSFLMVCLLLVPIMLRYRMAEYVLVDKPGLGALGALRESKKMMKGNGWNLIRLDISLWWYYGLSLLVSLVAYGDVFLSMLGVTLPWSQEVSYYGFLVGYQVLQFGFCVWLRNRVAVSYALAYDAIRPKEEAGNGVVLGNIFQM